MQGAAGWRVWVTRPAFLASLVLAVTACDGTESSESAGSPRATACGRARIAPRQAGAPATRARLRPRTASACLSRTRGAPRGLRRGMAPRCARRRRRCSLAQVLRYPRRRRLSFASAGFHPAELTVADGEFSPAGIGRALRRSGFRAAGRMLVRGTDGSIDSSTAAGRLSLSALNRVIPSPTRVTAASTSGLLRAARSSPTTLAADRDFAAAADALDPITSAIVLDASLVQPPSGVPTPILASFPARLVGVGIDDLGPSSRTIKIALVYESSDEARADAALIERDLPSTSLPGARSTTFSDLAADWRVNADGRAVVVTVLLPPNGNPGTWRSLVERGDLRGARQTAGLTCSQAEPPDDSLLRERRPASPETTPPESGRFRSWRELPRSLYRRRRSGAPR